MGLSSYSNIKSTTSSGVGKMGSRELSWVSGAGFVERACTAGGALWERVSGAALVGRAGTWCEQAAVEDWVGLEEGPHGAAGDVVAKAIQLNLVKDRVS